MSFDKTRMLHGKLYRADDPQLRTMHRHAQQLLYLYNQTAPEDDSARAKLLAQILNVPATDAHFEPPMRMDYGVNVQVGKNFYANFDSILLDVAPITIGDNVMFGPRVGIYTAGHPLSPTVRNDGLEYGHPITIGNNVWLGGNVTVCPGVTIGDDVVIGAGAVVTRDIPSGVIAAGVPATPIRPITEDDETYWQAEAAKYYSAKNNI
ncbi:sugar O-acetyltransferase [Lacticaseibacillus sharpeae]|uniref:Acetyltransferase n=1 Tax=Lacticaseibacillus sharpeae JCM 1186 = DSM 20505 TaxID=1291052 RepID=A0A0R1ZJ17_9LACO|nr:sugar O-acetyltransferase [Lacticaseibacillus sharpeae]KRM54992.1 maltose O-acetyltransferase [Lacticaseibacillus sharpeae JCM 1186 = DSM 20505]